MTTTLLGVGGEGAQRVYVCGCRDHLDMLMQADFVIGDDTFASAPNIVLQNYCGFKVVVLDCLLLCATRCVTSSNNLFQAPRSVVGSLQSRHAVVCGCYFHFGQAVFRRLNEIGLRQKFIDDPDFRTRCYEMTSFAFLPPTRQSGSLASTQVAFSARRIALGALLRDHLGGGESRCRGSFDSCPIPTNSLVSRGKVQFPLADHDQCLRAGSPVSWECSCPLQTWNARVVANVHPCSRARRSLGRCCCQEGSRPRTRTCDADQDASDAGNRGPTNYWAGLNAILPLAHGAISHGLVDGIHPFP